MKKNTENKVEKELRKARERAEKAQYKMAKYNAETIIKRCIKLIKEGKKIDFTMSVSNAFVVRDILKKKYKNNIWIISNNCVRVVF